MKSNATVLIWRLTRRPESPLKLRQLPQTSRRLAASQLYNRQAAMLHPPCPQTLHPRLALSLNLKASQEADGRPQPKARLEVLAQARGRRWPESARRDVSLSATLCRSPGLWGVCRVAAFPKHQSSSQAAQVAAAGFKYSTVCLVSFVKEFYVGMLCGRHEAIT